MPPRGTHTQATSVGSTWSTATNYNVGHMYEAAVAQYHATGKRAFLDIAIENADLIVAEFGPDGNHDAPGHEEIEIGLAKLYQVTGKQQYLDLAKFFVDQRGRHENRTEGRVLCPEDHGGGPEYAQDQSSRCLTDRGCGPCCARLVPVFGHGRLRDPQR